MSARHTPGPWVVRSNGYYPVVRREFPPGHHMDVCGPVHGYMYSSDEKGEQEANARLIAAAPDMYEVARKAAARFREYEALHAAKPDMEKARRNAEMAEEIEAALLKASPSPQNRGEEEVGLPELPCGAAPAEQADPGSQHSDGGRG